jgi:DNA polymerase III alpha subunit
MNLNNIEKYNLPQITNGVRLPQFEIEAKYKKELRLKDDCSDCDFLLALTSRGLDKIIGIDNPRYEEYKKRADYELGVFNELGFCSYLLITWDIINHCKENDIATGYGRGSAAGSLVLYLVGVTQIDSLKYGLYFERFLSRSRAKYKVIDGIKYYTTQQREEQ